MLVDLIPVRGIFAAPRIPDTCGTRYGELSHIFAASRWLTPTNEVEDFWRQGLNMSITHVSSPRQKNSEVNMQARQVCWQ